MRNEPSMVSAVRIRRRCRAFAWAIGMLCLPLPGPAEEIEETRIAVVSVETILEHLPARAGVERQLSERFAALQADADKKWKEVAELNKAFQDDQELLSQKAQAERQQKIIEKETALSEYWNKRAEEIQAQTEAASAHLSRQVEDQVISFARDQDYALIFDKSSGKLIYAADRFDRTDEVMQAVLGEPDSSATTTEDPGADSSTHDLPAEAAAP